MLFRTADDGHHAARLDGHHQDRSATLGDETVDLAVDRGHVSSAGTSYQALLLRDEVLEPELDRAVARVIHAVADGCRIGSLDLKAGSRGGTAAAAKCGVGGKLVGVVLGMGLLLAERSFALRRVASSVLLLRDVRGLVEQQRIALGRARGRCATAEDDVMLGRECDGPLFGSGLRSDWPGMNPQSGWIRTDAASEASFARSERRTITELGLEVSEGLLRRSRR